MAELEEVLVEWADKLVLWQRDLLRRVAEGETLSHDVIESFKDAVLNEFLDDNLPWYEPPESREQIELTPLTADNLQRASSSEPPTSLTRIHHLDRQNAANSVSLRWIADRSKTSCIWIPGVSSSPLFPTGVPVRRAISAYHHTRQESELFGERLTAPSQGLAMGICATRLMSHGDRVVGPFGFAYRFSIFGRNSLDTGSYEPLEQRWVEVQRNSKCGEPYGACP